MGKDDKELNELLSRSVARINYGRTGSPTVAENSSDDKPIVAHQWSSADSRVFMPTSNTMQELVPGSYDIKMSSDAGVYFEKVDIRTESLLKFPDSTSDKVILEIQKFWDRGNKFLKYGLPHKRGIMLYGPPGSGKSCLVRQIMDDVTQRDGIVFNFTSPNLFKSGYRIFRKIQPETPCVVRLEDMDAIIEMYNESDVINIIDGVEEIHKTVFLATTNYPERLGARIISRPSRFDKRFKIGMPSAAARRMYFENLCSQDNVKIDIDRWVKDTEDLSIAHLKELFIAVIILDDEYDDAIDIIQNMKDIVSSDDDRGNLGFKR